MKRACVYAVLSRSSESATKNLRIGHLNFFRIEKLFRVAVIFYQKASFFVFVSEGERINERKVARRRRRIESNRR